MKKRRCLLSLLLALCLIGAAAFLYHGHSRVKNVFDLMYYSRVHTNSLLSEFTSSRTYFQSVPQLKTPQRDADRGTIEFGNMVAEVYRSTYLEEGHHIRLMFYMSTHALVFDYWIDNDGGSEEWYTYRYSVDEKTLTYYTDTPEKPEMKNFLFDRVLPDWFAANEGRTRFSLENPGDYTLVGTEQ